MDSDISQQLQQKVQHACESKSALRIVGGNSKAFYGRPVIADVLNVSAHSGIINYEPTELVITARAGTPLSEIETVLENNGQMLAFEPPAFGPQATIGGTIACNFSGPRRACAGAARDFLLGCKIINGKGDILSFGGEVMKNVAGYDVSRLMAGALGTLGVLLEVSLKVLPKAEMESTLGFDCSPAKALKMVHEWSGTPMPVSATCYLDSTLHVRLSGASKAVAAAVENMRGDVMDNASHFWHQLKEHGLDFFDSQMPLWRISVASDIVSLELPGDYENDDCLYEWGGALRWLKSEVPADTIQTAAARHGGHATLFRHHAHSSIFQPLTPGLLRIHKNLKQAFDPENILNPGKLYPEL